VERARIDRSEGADIMKQDMNTAFIKEQIHSLIKKIKILDASVDLTNIENELIEYYLQKYAQEDAVPNGYHFIDLFCGAGGLSVGLEQEGFRPVMAIDKDASALLTYRFNRPWLDPKKLINEDIRKLVGKDVFEHVPLIVGGPPCQGFSVANKHKKENDERNILYKFYVHAVEQASPEVFLMENVEGLLEHIEEIRSDFDQIGYYVCSPMVLNTRDFGFPQSRRRAFILGISKRHTGCFDELYRLFANSIMREQTGSKYSLYDAIGELPQLEAKTHKNATYSECRAWGYTFGGFIEEQNEFCRLINGTSHSRRPLLNHKSKYNNERDIEIYRTLRPGEKSDAESIQAINPYKSRSDIFRDKFDKLRADEPCKTITAHMYYDCHMYIHPTAARGLTPREAARVQGFPDDYFFLGAPNEWYRQIGNAVSPLIGRVLARALNNVLQRIYMHDGDNSVL